MTKYFLGLDVGGTKTHALIATETGQVIGFGDAGGGNPEGIGYNLLKRVLLKAATKAFKQSGIKPEQISGAGFGIAGFDWPSQRANMLQAIGALNIHAPLEVVNDALVGLLAGASDGWGIAVVAGTGCNCWGWYSQRNVGRMTGEGIMMGEGAGAVELVFKAIQAISRAWSLRGPETCLTQVFTQLAGCQTVEELLEGLTTSRIEIDASAAPLIFEAAEMGDEVARNLIISAGQELGDLVNGVIRQLKFQDLEFEVIKTGSTFNGSPLLTESMATVIHSLAPKAIIKRLEAPPVTGGVLLGMEIAGEDFRTVRPALIDSTRRLFETIGTNGQISD
jgi:N-acetylglucosamine kinase-like BadF-type ATPase